MKASDYAGLFVLTLFLAMLVVELVAGRLRYSRQPGRDAWFSAVGLVAQGALAGPVVGGVAGWLLIQLLPASSGGWSDWPFWPVFIGFALAEDFLHYWLHRYAHEWRWLWKLHRTHHSATAMNVGLVFRYNVFWTLLLPQSWLSALLIYMGLPQVYFAVVALSFSVNVFTHTHLRWDLRLLELLPVLAPVWRLLARIVTTPDTHHAHHGLGRHANVRGNYAVVFFLWDTLLGTGRIPAARQEAVGLPHSGRIHWAEELLWPLVRRPLAPAAVTETRGASARSSAPSGQR